MTTAPDAQAGLWDATIENPGLEQLLDEHQHAKVAARGYGRLHKDLKKRLAEVKPKLEADTRYRIGRFIVTPNNRTGGGIEIPDWESTSYGVKAID
jgi:hypothetical protein